MYIINICCKLLSFIGNQYDSEIKCINDDLGAINLSSNGTKISGSIMTQHEKRLSKNEEKIDHSGLMILHIE